MGVSRAQLISRHPSESAICPVGLFVELTSKIFLLLGHSPILDDIGLIDHLALKDRMKVQQSHYGKKGKSKKVREETPENRVHKGIEINLLNLFIFNILSNFFSGICPPGRLLIYTYFSFGT